MIEPIRESIPTADGAMLVEFFGRTGSENQPGVIFYMDARGVRDELREMCSRIANEGYQVILPDLYHRLGVQIGFPSETSSGDPAETETIISHIHDTTIAGAMTDTQALLQWIDQHCSVGIGVLGAVGYCMGGPFAISAAGNFPDRINAAASFYGVNCMTDNSDSPHLLARRVSGKLYFGYAEHDHLAPVTEIPKLESYLTKLGVPHEIEIYQDADHGFAFPRRKTYNHAADQRHWEAMFRLFRTNLG